MRLKTKLIPYYKHNQPQTRNVTDLTFSLLLCLRNLGKHNCPRFLIRVILILNQGFSLIHQYSCRYLTGFYLAQVCKQADCFSIPSWKVPDLLNCFLLKGNVMLITWRKNSLIMSNERTTLWSGCTRINNVMICVFGLYWVTYWFSGFHQHLHLQYYYSLSLFKNLSCQSAFLPVYFCTRVSPVASLWLIWIWASALPGLRFCLPVYRPCVLVACFLPDWQEYCVVGPTSHTRKPAVRSRSTQETFNNDKWSSGCRAGRRWQHTREM